VTEAWGEWSSGALGERPVSEKKIRKVVREVGRNPLEAPDTLSENASEETVDEKRD
jgi:hypothetical protein